MVVNITGAMPDYVEGLGLKLILGNPEGIFTGYDVADERVRSAVRNLDFFRIEAINNAPALNETNASQIKASTSAFVSF